MTDKKPEKDPEEVFSENAEEHIHEYENQHEYSNAEQNEELYDYHDDDSSHIEASHYNDNYVHPDYFEDDSHEFSGDQKKMALGDHLEELRGCFFKCMFIVFLVAIACAIYYKEIFEFLLAPVRIAMQGETLQSSISETFTVMLKGILLTATAISLPLIIKEGWNFAKPGLKIKEQRFLVSIMFLGTLFFFCGMLMAYFFVVPITINFFKDFNENMDVHNLFYVGQSLNYVINIMLVFGIAFETPLVVSGLLKSGIVEISTLKGMRKYVLFGAVLAGGILTPPDPMSQILLGGTLYGLFEVGLVLGKIGSGTSKETN